MFSGNVSVQVRLEVKKSNWMYRYAGAIKGTMGQVRTESRTGMR